jgi:uncharacterized protein YcaQ
MKFKVYFILALVISASLMLSCRSRMTQGQKRAYKMEKQMKKENEKMVAEYHEHHYNIQPVETQKMMKKSKKRAKKVNKKRGDSWFKRTFSRKRKSCNGN